MKSCKDTVLLRKMKVGWRILGCISLDRISSSRLERVLVRVGEQVGEPLIGMAPSGMFELLWVEDRTFFAGRIK